MASRARAQAYVEYGILVAVVVIGFLVGLNVLMGAAKSYIGHAEPTPNATVLANLPVHVVAISMSCTPPPPPVYTGQPFTCSLTVMDITTVEPGRLPAGTMAFSSTTGTFNPNPCQLHGPISNGVTSGCTFQYTPTNTRQQNMTATYHPTSGHQSRSAQLLQVILALDKTQTQLVCVSQVPVGEPSQCTVAVLDLFTNQLLPGASLGMTTSAGGGATGTFSAFGTLSPRGAAYTCVTASNGVCGTLFRSGSAGAAEQVLHSVVAAFQGDQDYDSSNTAAVVNVVGPTQHPVKVDIACAGGLTPQSPLQISLGASTACTATVTDVNAADSNGNPTNITPTGTLSWTASPGFGGAGSLSSTTCTLQPVTDTVAQCQPQTTYTPTSVGTPPGPTYVGTHQVAATYSTDWIHPQVGNDLQGSTNVYVQDQHLVQVSVTCTAGTTRALPLLITGASADTTQCTLMVQDVNPTNQVTPTGIVAWGLSANGGTGAFAPSAPCQLQPVNNSTAQCQLPVTYQPTTRGTSDGPDQESTHTIVATYSGDWLHPLINNDLVGSTNVFVGNLHAVQVMAACSPATTRLAPLQMGPPATTTACTVMVTDPSPTPLTPTGSVAWSMSSVGAGAAGVFSPSAPCQLQPVNNSTAGCQTPATYQPTARGTPDGPDMDNTHQIVATYSGDGLHPPNNNDEIGTTLVYVHN